MSEKDRELARARERMHAKLLGTTPSYELDEEAREKAMARLEAIDRDGAAWEKMSDDERRAYAASHRKHGLTPATWLARELAESIPEQLPWEVAIAEQQQRAAALESAERWRARQIERWNADLQQTGVPPDADRLADPEGHQRRQDFERRMARIQRLQKADPDALLTAHARYRATLTDRMHASMQGQPAPAPEVEVDDEPPAPRPRPELR